MMPKTLFTLKIYLVFFNAYISAQKEASPRMTPKETITRLKEADEQVFKALFHQHYASLCSYMKTYTTDRDLAEELVQKSFFKLWQKRENLEIKSSVKSYLFAMTRNNFLELQRKKKREEKLIAKLKYEAIQEEMEQDEELQAQKIAQLRQLIENLPPRCKEVLQLKQKGLKYQEIADTLGISVKSVESQMRIAFRKIKEGFEGHSVFLLLFCDKMKMNTCKETRYMFKAYRVFRVHNNAKLKQIINHKKIERNSG